MSVTDLVEMSVSVVNSHLTMNRMSSRDVPDFIRQVHETLKSLRQSAETSIADQAPASAAPKVAATSAPAIEKEDRATQVELPIEENLAGGAEEASGTKEQPNKIAQIRQEDISDPVFKGLDPWLAKRISPNTAKKLNPKNKIHPSVFPEHLICLEDGAQIKLLRPHIGNRYGLTIAEYVDKWNLPDDYPTAPPAYIERKRLQAKKSGLGITTRANREKPKSPASARAGGGRSGQAQAAAGGRARSEPAVADKETASAPKARSNRGSGTRRKLSLFQKSEQPA